MQNHADPHVIEIKHFNLQFTRESSGRYLIRVLESPVGSGAIHAFSLPFEPAELAALHGLTPITAAQMRTLGERLYATVFAGDVRQSLLSTLHMLDARANAKVSVLLQIRLWLSETPELAGLPWELLYLSELGLHLALMPNVSLIRHLNVSRSVVPTPVAPPLNILCVIAAPSDLDSLDAESEWQRLQADFKQLVTRGQVRVQRLPQATFAALAEHLKTETVHILHFIGHGFIDSATQNDGLIFEDAAGAAQLVSGDQLVQVLNAHQSLRLVVLNACGSAQSADESAHVGVAQRLVVGGLPAVIAMQFLITDEAARAFAQEFYRSLSAGSVVDVAMQQARQAIYAQPNPVEWVTPVLFEAKGEPLKIVESTAKPNDDGNGGGNGSGKLRWLLAALAVLLVVFGMGLLLTNESVRCLLRLASCESDVNEAGTPTTIAAVTAIPAASSPTLEATIDQATVTPVIAARPPITVGFAALLGCSNPDLRDALQRGVEDELRSVDLLDTRVFIEPIDDAIVDDPGARRYKGRYDIVVWGGCEPATQTVQERVTVTATLILVGDSLEEAVSHRVAQPDAVVLTLSAENESLLSQGIGAVSAYYGELEINSSLRLLSAFASRVRPYIEAIDEQLNTVEWLVGNAALEHPKLLFTLNPIDANPELYRLSHTAYTDVLGRVTSLQTPIVTAAIQQNLGWLFLLTGQDENARAGFQNSLVSNPALVSAAEGTYYVNSSMGASPSELDELCNNMIGMGGVAQGTYCIARNEWFWGSKTKAVERAKYSVQTRPDYALSYLILARSACALDHQESQAISWYKEFLEVSLKMARWDTLGYEAGRSESNTEILRLTNDPNGCEQ